MRKLALVALAALVPVDLGSGAIAAPTKPAAGKTPPACGVKFLPLVAGNSWTYENVGARTIKNEPIAMREDLVRSFPAPPAPKKIVITVKNVDSKGADKDTVATLEEVNTYEVRDLKGNKSKTTDVKITSTITCNKQKMIVSPESFFFQAEPGGYQELKFDKFDRKKDTGWKLSPTGTVGEGEWREEIVAHWMRSGKNDARLGSGTLELERRFVPEQSQRIATKYGTYDTERLGIEVTGRVKLDKPLAPEGKPCLVKEPDGKEADGKTPKFKDKLVEQCDLPANWFNELWFVDNVGVIQSLNTYAHMYQLVAATLH
jgi:hypothetical protein